ncbi:MAG: hypothetical protein J0I77_02010 [Rudaea sp.]|uniref:hypothetical protein n=1 Tax=unclassified Rudaea TaxID=2627037 RepID=UPI0010F64600|nr:MULTISPECIES: hypothetical protein [unclassified Rudaea]MBN8884470.1 hypothetical protein [Rudaea sp.]
MKNANYSLTSLLLDFLGRRLIASHERLGLNEEFGDFYFQPGDRAIVDVEDAKVRGRLVVNELRIRLFQRAAWTATALAFILSLVGMLALVGIRGVGSVFHSVSVSIEQSALDRDLANVDCEELVKRYGTTQLKPEQFAAFRKRCGDAGQSKPSH